MVWSDNFIYLLILQFLMAKNTHEYNLNKKTTPISSELYILKKLKNPSAKIVR